MIGVLLALEDVTEGADNQASGNGAFRRASGLNNRRILFGTGATAIKRARLWRESSLIKLDIDNFRGLTTNMEWCGDEGIQAISDLLKSVLPGNRHNRQGWGEEFSIVMLNSKSKEAFATAERSGAGLNRQLCANGQRVPVTSVGIAGLENSSETA
jgi:diguanylate cyclase (GGDEF)-like protein